MGGHQVPRSGERRAKGYRIGAPSVKEGAFAIYQVLKAKRARRLPGSPKGRGTFAIGGVIEALR